MRKRIVLISFVAAVVGLAATAQAAVEYAKICSLYGDGFFYIPGTDTCYNPANGDTRRVVQDPFTGDSRVLRTMLPYPEGRWTTRIRNECAPGRAVKVGTYKSTDFTLNHFDGAQTPPFSLPLKSNEYISKVIMSGGFYDPRLPQARSGTNIGDGLCVRSVDPTVLEKDGDTVTNPLFGNDGLPIGCIAGSRITGMPAAYAINATAAYQNVDMYFNDVGQTDLAGPYVYGTQLVLTTDWRYKAPPTALTGGYLLSYHDVTDGTDKPLAGTVSVTVCVAAGLP